MAQSLPLKRLDFATTYFELGSSYSPSFVGGQLAAANEGTSRYSAALTPYLNWGGFHFWGHAEFYVSFPLGHVALGKQDKFTLGHGVVTGARALPWSYQPGRLSPYVGLSWASMEFSQGDNESGNAPVLSKDFLWVPEIGLLYGTESLAVRLGAKYFHDNRWNYPVTTSDFAAVFTPKVRLELGVIYSFESSHSGDAETDKRWNNYPALSPPSVGSDKGGDFFVGAGPSSSFSLQPSTYNQNNVRYLKGRLLSPVHLEVSAGYQFYQLGLIAALSFRTPRFETQGYGSTQTIKKWALALEVSKYLADYSGFAPYLGLNVSYDHLDYTEETGSTRLSVSTKRVEPGLTLGWDIIPGKLDEALVLRTNLRWYPWSSFEVNSQTFDFSQLEYNVIQIIFYPGRL